MKRLVLSLILLCSMNLLSAWQGSPNGDETIHLGYVSYTFPEGWKLDDDKPSYLLLSGIGDNIDLPRFFQGEPIYVNAFLREVEAKSLKKARRVIINEYLKEQDVLFGIQHSRAERTYRLASGQSALLLKAQLVHSDFDFEGYETRYDLVMHSETDEEYGFVFTLIVQHSDPDFQIDKEYQLDSFANSFFQGFHLNLGNH